MQKSYIGKGTIYIGPADGSGPLRSMGNCSSLVLNIEEDTKEQIDYTSPSGGLANSLSSITSVGMEITALDISAENLALSLRATNVAITAGAVADEAHTSYKGGLIPLDYTPDTAETVTVTGTGGTPSYAENTDFTVTRGGVFIPETSTIADATALEISYTKAASNVVEALTESGKEYKMVFDGLNEADSGKATTLTMHKTKFSPAQGLGLISDDFGEMTLSAAVIKDTTKIGAGISQYMKIAQAA